MGVCRHEITREMRRKWHSWKDFKDRRWWAMCVYWHFVLLHLYWDEIGLVWECNAACTRGGFVIGNINTYPKFVSYKVKLETGISGLVFRWFVDQHMRQFFHVKAYTSQYNPTRTYTKQLMINEMLVRFIFPVKYVVKCLKQGKCHVCLYPINCEPMT